MEKMEFPNTFDEFAKDYGLKDKKEVYTNGSYLIPVFRVKQWLEHIEQKTQFIEKSNFDRKQYNADLQSAYDCGKASQEPNTDVLNKIKEEITNIEIHVQIDSHTYFERTGEQVKNIVLDIVDKYKAESEGPVDWRSGKNAWKK